MYICLWVDVVARLEGVCWRVLACVCVFVFVCISTHLCIFLVQVIVFVRSCMCLCVFMSICMLIDLLCQNDCLNERPNYGKVV